MITTLSGNSIEIGLVLYPEAQMAAVLGLTDLFTLANMKAQAQSIPQLRISHWNQHSEIPHRVFDTASAPEVDSPTVLILPPSLGEPIPTEKARPLAAWLRERHEQGTILCSICAGAFVLGETGLFAGRTITTHWGYDDALHSRFPDSIIDTDRLIIDDGDIITAGGLMAWVDLGLKLVDRFLGAATMIETARQLLVDPPGREQSFYSSFSPRMAHGDVAVLKVQHWLQVTADRKTSLNDLATLAGLEERTFQRRFQRATGLAPTEYVQRLRVGKARDLLQFGSLTVDEVAAEVGYVDPGAFRKVFNRIVGLSPASYRKRFRTK